MYIDFLWKHTLSITRESNGPFWKNLYTMSFCSTKVLKASIRNIYTLSRNSCRSLLLLNVCTPVSLQVHGHRGKLHPISIRPPSSFRTMDISAWNTIRQLEASLSAAKSLWRACLHNIHSLPCQTQPQKMNTIKASERELKLCIGQFNSSTKMSSTNLLKPCAYSVMEKSTHERKKSSPTETHTHTTKPNQNLGRNRKAIGCLGS